MAIKNVAPPWAIKLEGRTRLCGRPINIGMLRSYAERFALHQAMADLCAENPACAETIPVIRVPFHGEGGGLVLVRAEDFAQLLEQVARERGWDDHCFN